MADNNTILEKLEGLVARFEEVSTLITDPAVIADQKRYVKLTKEYKAVGGLGRHPALRVPFPASPGLFRWR